MFSVIFKRGVFALLSVVWFCLLLLISTSGLYRSLAAGPAGLCSNVINIINTKNNDYDDIMLQSDHNESDRIFFE